MILKHITKLIIIIHLLIQLLVIINHQKNFS